MLTKAVFYYYKYNKYLNFVSNCNLKDLFTIVIYFNNNWAANQHIRKSSKGSWDAEE